MSAASPTSAAEKIARHTRMRFSALVPRMMNTAAVAGAFVVRKWSQRSHDDPEAPRVAAPPSAEDAELQARLDRELENLD